MTKRVNPYTRLMDDFRAYWRSVIYAKRTTMWVYPKARLNEGWTLGDLHERVKAADQLKHDVILEATDEGLVVKYRVRPDPQPRWDL